MLVGTKGDVLSIPTGFDGLDHSEVPVDLVFHPPVVGPDVADRWSIAVRPALEEGCELTPRPG